MEPVRALIRSAHKQPRHLLAPNLHALRWESCESHMRVPKACRSVISSHLAGRRASLLGFWTPCLSQKPSKALRSAHDRPDDGLLVFTYDDDESVIVHPPGLTRMRTCRWSSVHAIATGRGLPRCFASQKCSPQKLWEHYSWCHTVRNLRSKLHHLSRACAGR